MFSRIFTGGSMMPSSKLSRAFGQKLPGVMPPISYWCRQLVIQANNLPPQNTGQSSMTSC